MAENRIENYIGDALTGETRQTAADFFEYLLGRDLRFECGQGYWADRLYWMIKHTGEFICFILINNKTEPSGWTVWISDNPLNIFADFKPDERTSEILLKHIDICGKCGGCENPGGSRKNIFGQKFDNVCVTPMRFDNPDVETVECVKKMISYGLGE